MSLWLKICKSLHLIFAARPMTLVGNVLNCSPSYDSAIYVMIQESFEMVIDIFCQHIDIIKCTSKATSCQQLLNSDITSHAKLYHITGQNFNNFS
jgi:hypothetical protein